MARTTHLVLPLGLALGCGSICAQTVPEPGADEEILIDTSPFDVTPLVMGHASDGFPDTLDIAGVTVAVSQAPSGCGVMYWSGSAAVRLDAPAGFPREIVHVVVPCFSRPDLGFVGRRFSLRAVKTIDAEGAAEAYAQRYGGVWNRLDSAGAPFYVPVDPDAWGFEIRDGDGMGPDEPDEP